MNKAVFKPWLYNVIPLVIWLLLFVLPFVSAPVNMPAAMHRHFITNVLTTNSLLLAVFYLHSYLIYPLLKKGWVPYLAGLAALLIGYWLLWYLFHTPMPPPGHFEKQLTDSLQSFKPGARREPFGPHRGGPVMFMPVIGPLITILCSYCYRVIIDNAKREQLLKEQETEHLRTELSFLRSQINPHFLFNILNNLASLARKRSEYLEPAIVNLSQLMRYMLYESDDNKVPLTKEIAYLKSYIDLQLLRFGDEVSVKTELNGEHQLYSIDPMLLIALVENAFKHGTGQAAESMIFIKMNIDAEEHKLHFMVINSFTPSEYTISSSSGIGLRNLKRRLDILYPGKHTLKTRDDGMLYTAELTIDLK